MALAELSIQPLEGKPLRSVELATHRLNLWEGAVRSAKTVASLFAFLHFTVHGPRGLILITGKTERTILRNVVYPLRDLLGPSRVDLTAGAGEVRIAGRLCLIAGGNDEGSSLRIRGLTLAGAYVDEWSTLPETFTNTLLDRLSVAGARLFGTTNPDGPSHYIASRFLPAATVWLDHAGELHYNHEPRARALDLARFSFRLRDNPWLPAEYVAAVEAQHVGVWRARMVEGKWVAAEGAIYPHLDLTPGGPHVLAGSLPPLAAGWRVAVDHGTVNPFVGLLMALTADGERLVVAREWRWDSRARQQQLTDAEYAARLVGWLAGLDLERLVIDPAAAGFRLTARQAGLPARSANNKVVPGIRLVASLLATGRLAIHESCAGLLAELAGYVWDPNAPPGVERPLKENDHGPDALRYGVMSWRRWARRWVADLPDSTADAA